jgi:cytochrome P450
MARIEAILTTIGRFLVVSLEGLQAAGWLVANGARIRFGAQGKAGLIPFLTAPPTQIMIFQALRAFWPNVSTKRVLMKAYDNTGTAIITRRRDVLDVLNRDADFEVVYGPRMQALTEGENFFLGMQPGWDYTRDTSAMRLAARTTDVEGIVLPRARELAETRVAEAGGRLDVPQALSLEVPWDMTRHYFGVGGERETMQDWTTTLFWYLFGDLAAAPTLHDKAMRDAAGLRAYLDDTIAQQKKAAPDGAETILSRCLALQKADTPGMSDLGIRNNLLGLLIGAIPTISKASCLALDELLRRPDMLRRAQGAARENDESKLANCIWEALRFNPHNAVVYRRALRDTVVGEGTFRQMRIRKGQMVFAVTQSAMFDRFEIPSPKDFRTDRPFSDYIIWGYGLHTCFGAAINEAIIPAVLKPLLQRSNLRRAEGSAGQLDTGGTPFPQHLHVTFDT